MAKESEIPQYRKLYEFLRKSIVDGVYSEGTLIPSENELCRIHNITRPTVRQALTALVNDGYIIKQKGKGSIVMPLPRNIGILSISSTTTAVGGDLKTKIITKPEIIPWDENFIFPVNDEYKGVGCIYFERLRLLNNVPVFYDISYIPNINMPRFTSRNLEDKSLFDVLRTHYGIEVKGGEQRLKAISADKRIAGYLNVKPGAPVLNLERRMDTNRIGFSFYSVIFCNTSAHALSGNF